MNTEQLMRFVGDAWDKSIVPALCEYIRIPNKSAHFDKDWEKLGYMDAAAELMRQWCEANALPGMKIRTEVVAFARSHALAVHRCAGLRAIRTAPTACSCTVTWTSNRSSPAGPRASRRGRR